MDWVNRASRGSAEFAGLGQALIPLIVEVPLTILVTGMLFWRVPLRSWLGAGAFALVRSIDGWQSLFKFGVTSHVSHADWPLIALVIGFGFATWISLPGRSPIVGAARRLHPTTTHDLVHTATYD